MSVYVGIPNDGALCYLISIIQQLYFIPDFKEKIMSADYENEKAQALIEKVRTLFVAMDEQKDDNDVQCEPIFGHLYPDLADGIYTQKDASEFLSDFIRSLSLDTQLRGILTGQLVNTLSTLNDGNGAPRHLERPEKFLFTSLTVNCPDGINNLEASLKDFTKTETIQFRWNPQPEALSSAPLTPMSTQKQTMYRVLPKHLTFHLKRFKFNISTMKKEKLHHRFEFPDELDMSSYVSRSDTESCDTPAHKSSSGDATEPTETLTSYQYKLSGVVVHKGKSAYSGHYYSFIRERRHHHADISKAMAASAELDPEFTQFTTADATAITSTDISAPTAVSKNDLSNMSERLQSVSLTDPAAAAAAPSADRWFLFDDFDVMPFNPAYLDRECFGGPFVKTRRNICQRSTSSACSGTSQQSCDSIDKSEVPGVTEDTEETSPQHKANIPIGDVPHIGANAVNNYAISTDEVELPVVNAECIDDCPEKLNGSEHGDAENTNNSCCGSQSSGDNNSDNDSSCGKCSEEISESNNESHDDSSYDSDSSDDYDSSESDASCSSSEEGSYIPTRGKFKSALLLFYDRIGE